MSSPFETWLSRRLVDLGTDESVFLPYIVSILQGEDESPEEKEEGLVGLLSDVLEDEEKIKETLAQILEQWNKENASVIENELKKASEDMAKLDLVEQMNQITQEKIATYTPKKQEEQSEDQKRIKEAILQGYAEAADGSDEEDEEGGGQGHGGGHVDVVPGLDANTNAASSHAEQVEMRERQKAASAAKKEKDKTDRENQKKGQEDRKKKAQAKAQKGERKA